jgi:predicted HicB family RNase H-like nuclease
MAKKLDKDPVVQTGLRISTSLRDQLAEAAERHNVSLNSEMERRLSESFTAVSREEVMGLVKTIAQESADQKRKNKALEAEVKRLTAELKRAEYVTTRFEE